MLSRYRKIKEDGRFSAAEDRGRYSVSGNSAAKLSSLIFHLPLSSRQAKLAKVECQRLRFEAFLPDGLDTLAEVIKDMPACDATAGREETTDDAGDVAPDIKVLRVVNTDAFHTKAETSDAWKDNRLSFRQPMFQDVL